MVELLVGEIRGARRLLKIAHASAKRRWPAQLKLNGGANDSRRHERNA